MKNLILFLAVVILAASCKKNPNKAFLKGKLVTDCSNTPVANRTIYLYQNFVPAPNVLTNDTQEKILESTTTDENGNFYFWGDGYTNDGTTSLNEASIRLDEETTILVGDIGKGKGENAGDISHLIQDVGIVYESSATLSFKVTADTLYEGQVIDSVLFSTYQAEHLLTLTDKSSGQFEMEYNWTHLHHPITYRFEDSDGKHAVFFTYSCYSGGQSIAYVHMYLPVATCSSGESYHIEY